MKYNSLHYLEIKGNIWSIIITENAESQLPELKPS
jgi:hypothetical protein